MTLQRFHERRADVLRALANLCDVSRAIGANALAGKVDADVVRKLEADRFHLVVVGEFNHGKSTFVNALLGSELLPSGITPTTAVIHHLLHAPEPYARALFASGETEEIPLPRLRAWTAEERAAKEAADVSYVEVGYPAKLLEERIVLVDTPGVNDLSLSRADITYKYIPRSDAVLFLLDAGQMLKESERVFLMEKLIGRSRDKIVFVVNKADIWADDERDEALAYVRRELAKLLPEPVVFPVSAQRALAGDVDASGLPALLEHLSRFLAEQRGRIVLDHALAEGLAVSALLAQGVEAKRSALRMTREDLERRIDLVGRDAEGQVRTIDARRAAIREEVAAIKAWARRDLENFTEDVIRQIPGVIDAAASDDLKQHLAAFLEATFREWAQAETREIAGALERLAEKTIAMVKEETKDAAGRLGETLAVKPPSIDVDTFAYDVGIFALFTVGLTTMFANLLLGGMLALAAPLLALYVRDKVEIETKKKAKELAPAALREASAQVGPKLDGMIDDFAQQLDAWVVSTGNEMHRDMLDVLKAAREELSTRAPGDEASERELEAQRERLEAVRADLDRQRADVWAAEA